MATLSINGQPSRQRPELSLFDHAESAGIRVPTSCRKQGKCKECMVEIVEGMSGLSPRTEFEEHLKGDFRLSCQAHPSESAGAHPLPHHAPRRHADRSGDRPPGLSARRSARLARQARTAAVPYGLALDLGTTTVVLRLLNLRTGEIVADSSFENPQRFGGSEVMSRIQYDTDTSRQAPDAHAGRLSHPRHRRVSRRSA